MSSTLGKKVTKWTCDVCQVAAFDTFQEAEQHEKKCRQAQMQTKQQQPKQQQPKQQQQKQVMEGGIAVATNYQQQQQQQQYQHQQNMEMLKFHQQQQQQQQQQQLNGNHHRHPPPAMVIGYHPQQPPTQQQQPPHQLLQPQQIQPQNPLQNTLQPFYHHQQQQVHQMTMNNNIMIASSAPQQQLYCSPTQQVYHHHPTSNQHPHHQQFQGVVNPPNKPHQQKKTTNKETKILPPAGQPSQEDQKENKGNHQQSQKMSTENIIPAYKTIWTCDVCKIAEFDNFEKAVAHEKSCTGIPPPSPKLSQATPLLVPNKAKSTSNPHYPVNKNLQENQSLVENCTSDSGGTNANATPNKSARGGQPVTAKKCFVCDICRNAFFETFEEAEAHELICKNIQSKKSAEDKHPSPQPQPQSQQEPIEGGGKGSSDTSSLSTIASALPSGAMLSSAILPSDKDIPHQPRPMQPPVRSLNKSNNDKPITFSDSKNKKGDSKTLGVLKKAHNEEDQQLRKQQNLALSPSIAPITALAQQNEELSSSSSRPLSASNKVILAPKESKSIPKTAPFVIDLSEEMWQENDDTRDNESVAQNHPQTIIQKTTIDSNIGSSLGTESNNETSCSTTDLSPLLRSEEDSSDFYKLSFFQATLMSSIDLFEEDEKGIVNSMNDTQLKTTCTHVSFRCTHCKKKLVHEETGSSSWTTDLVANKLCTITYEHLLSFCKKVPAEKIQRLKDVAPQKECGKISFPAFISKFFAENGIIDVKMQGLNTKPSHMTLLTPPELVKIHQRNNNDNITSSCQLRRKTDVLAFTEKSELSYHTYPMSGLDGEGTRLEKCLSPMNKIAVRQMTFMVENERKSVHQNPMHHVAIQCKHCGSSTYLNSLKGWFRVVYTMIYSHLIKSCQRIPADIRDQLIAQQGKKKLASNTSGIKTTGLKQYCVYLANLYNFKESESAFGSRVGVQEIISLPKARPTKKRREHRKRKFTEPESSMKSKSNNCIDDKETKKAKKSRNTSNKISTTPASQENERSNPNHNFKNGILIEGEDGCSAFLTPTTGVPLLSSLTASMAAELNVHNKLLVTYFELCEEVDENSSTSGPFPLALRCQNCNSDPSKAFKLALPSLPNFFKFLGKCRNHLECCKSTPEAIRKEITRTKSINSIGCTTLREYCEFITQLYGMVDTISSTNGDNFVSWGTTRKYMLSNYKSSPGKLVKYQKQSGHDEKKLNKHHSSTSHTKRPRIILSDYHYFLLGQIELATLPELSQNLKGKVQVGIRCKHCGNTNVMKSIENFVCHRLHRYYSHFKCCPEVSNEFIENMEDLKSKYEEQHSSNESLSTLEEAAMVVLEDIFQLENSESINQGVVLNTQNSNAWGIIQKLGTSQDNLNLKICEMSVSLSISKIFFPVLLSNVMIPLSSSK